MKQILSGKAAFLIGIVTAIIVAFNASKEDKKQKLIDKNQCNIWRIDR
jgi:hypothetical protein